MFMSTLDWIDTIPQLKALSKTDKQLLCNQARQLEVPARTRVFTSGQDCEAFLIVLEGSVRVQMIGDNGREIVLYRVENGQTCVLTTSCLLSHEAYNAEGITETDTRGIAIPAPAFQNLLDNCAGFRDMVFASYGQRISSLVLLVEEVAFKRIDVRLAQFIHKHQDQTGTLARTHHDLAVELGSAREVISRQLKEFEKKGWISLSRGKLQVRDNSALNSFITHHCD